MWLGKTMLIGRGKSLQYIHVIRYTRICTGRNIPYQQPEIILVIILLTQYICLCNEYKIIVLMKIKPKTELKEEKMFHLHTGTY